MTEQITLVGADNPEKNAIISDLFSKLSTEAQMLISVIIHTPNELAKNIFSGVITKRKVRKYLKAVGYDTREINMVLNSVKLFYYDITKV